jgi:hypothetical protein
MTCISRHTGKTIKSMPEAWYMQWRILMKYSPKSSMPDSTLSFARRVAASALLSLLFLAVYSATNHLTAMRTDVGTWFYGWERLIPFVPWMLIPYMSIDLFFVAAPFVCTDRRELATFCRRVVLAILAGGVCFLAMPLKLGFERPHLDGWMAAAFGWFFSADLPYNLCPSLHITLRTILAATYARHTRGLLKIAVGTWFCLIGFSTVLTHQHQVVDVAGGFLLAALCFYFVPAENCKRQVTPNRRIGAYYLTAAVASGFLAAWQWPWGGVFLWPAAACTIAAAGYFGMACGLGFGPGMYRKTGGRIPWYVRILLAPLLIGQHASLWHYRRQCRAWDAVTPNLWIGRKLSNTEAAEAMWQGVTAVLDLTAEFSEAETFLAVQGGQSHFYGDNVDREGCIQCAAKIGTVPGIMYLNVPILDLTAPTPEQLRQCVDFIEKQARDGIVYVHCKIGYSRTAAAAAAYLLADGQASSAEEAMSRLRAVRPSIVIRPEAAAAIRDFHIK